MELTKKDFKARAFSQGLILYKQDLFDAIDALATIKIDAKKAGDTPAQLSTRVTKAIATLTEANNTFANAISIADDLNNSSNGN